MFIKNFFPENISTPPQNAIASYDPLSQSYSLIFVFPSALLDPVIESSPEVQFAVPSFELSFLKDNFLNKLLADVHAET